MIEPMQVSGSNLLPETDGRVAGSPPVEIGLAGLASGFSTRDVAMRWLGLRGAMTVRQLASNLARSGIDAPEDFIETLAIRGDVCRFKTLHGELIAATGRRETRLGGRTIVTGAAESTGATVETGSDDEALAALLGPPSWRRLMERGDVSDVYEFAVSRGSALENAEDEAERVAWRQIADAAEVESALTGSHAAPKQVRRLALLLEDWSDSEKAEIADSFRLWAGLTGPRASRDPAQERVAQIEGRERAVVVAGPGAGKTHTILARLEALVSMGLSPARLFAVSFTRGAVAEMRRRLNDVLDSEEIELGTLDSLAARFIVAARPGTVLFDHEKSIRDATSILKSGNAIVQDWLREREHLIVDEAQDIVGSRRAFLLSLLEHLPETCGVTIFCDPAQAIYGFQGHGDAPVYDAMAERGFTSHALQRNHRTRSDALIRFEREGRRSLEEGGDGDAVLGQVRALVEEAASGPPPEPGGAQRMPGLLLFRSGGEAAWHAARLADHGIPVALRGGRAGQDEPAFAPAWFGAAALSLAGNGRNAIDAAADALASDPLAPDAETLETAMKSGLVNGRYDSEAFANMLHDGRAPRESVSAATLRLSTIHAAKGQEADDVALYLPRDAREDDLPSAEVLEEARILYVAGTRACRRLFVAPAGGTMRREGRRFWRRQGESVLVQLSRHDAPETRLEPHCNPVDFACAPARRDVILRWRPDDRRWGLIHRDAEDDGIFALLPPSFSDDVSAICRSAFPDRRFVPVAHGRFQVWTFSVAHEEAVHVVPVLEGFARIRFARKAP